MDRNSFGSQEPGSNAEILTFAKDKDQCEHHKKRSGAYQNQRFRKFLNEFKNKFNPV
jgi:hypothetical protein